MRSLRSDALGAVCLLLFLAPCGLALAQDDWSHFEAQTPTVDQPGRREWTWQGGDSLSVGGPGRVRYVQTGSPRIIITGDPQIVSAMEVDGGEIREHNNSGWFNFRHNDNVNLSIVVQGMKLNRFTLSGSGTMDVGRVQGDALAFRVSGSGAINAQGQARTLELSVSGSGKANLGGLQADAAKVRISGSGTATTGAIAQDAEIQVSGSGTVNTGNAKSVDIDVSGSGRVSPGTVESANINLSGSGSVLLGSRPAHENYNISGGGTVLMKTADGGTTELASRHFDRDIDAAVRKKLEKLKFKFNDDAEWKDKPGDRQDKPDDRSGGKPAP